MSEDRVKRFRKINRLFSAKISFLAEQNFFVETVKLRRQVLELAVVVVVVVVDVVMLDRPTLGKHDCQS